MGRWKKKKRWHGTAAKGGAPVSGPKVEAEPDHSDAAGERASPDWASAAGVEEGIESAETESASMRGSSPQAAPGPEGEPAASSGLLGRLADWWHHKAPPAEAKPAAEGGAPIEAPAEEALPLEAAREPVLQSSRALEEELGPLRPAEGESLSELREALRTATERIQSLEIDLTQSRDETAAARVLLGQAESRWQGLEEQVARSRAPTDELLEQLHQEREATSKRLEVLRTLEAELAQTRTELEAARTELRQRAGQPQELEAALAAQRERAQELVAKVEELTQQLAARERELAGARSQSDKELEQARQEARRALGQLRDLETALRQAESVASERQAELVAQKSLVESLQRERPAAAPKAAPAGESAAAAGTPQAVELYKRALTPLTVIVASADLLAMSPRLEPALRESAQDVKFHSQALMELLKKFAYPSETK